MKFNFESTMHTQRFVLGVICGLLPIGCILFGLFGNYEGGNLPSWWTSISATYYANSNMWMIGALTLACFFLGTYKGYDLGDKILTDISSISSIGIVIFPCMVPNLTRVGIFQLPIKISHTIHCIFAAALFVSFAIMILTQFTKGTDKKRNIVYYICGSTIILFIISQIASVLLKWPGVMTMVNEFGMLEAFAVAWIVKSKVVIETPASRKAKKNQTTLFGYIK